MQRRRHANVTGAISRWVLLFSAILTHEPAISQPFTNTATFLENQKPGTKDWLLTNPGGIEGYASLTSVNRGGQINLFVNTTNSAYSLAVYRLGWYGGTGARLVLGPVSVPGTSQAIPSMDPVTGLVECNWTNPYTLTVPATPGDPTDWASGVYLAKLTGSDDGGQSYIIFAVRDDARAADLLVQMSFSTYEAYNAWGGASLYDFNSKPARAKKVSFNRPFTGWDPYWKGTGDFFAGTGSFGAGWECNLVRWLEREGYDVTYCTSVDTHALTNLLWNHKAFVSMGHDEYWSYPMRWNVKGARDRGINLAFLSSNTSYWQVRFEPSTADGTANRTMVCYKSTADPIFNTPSNYFTTVAFRSAPVPDWESSLLGVSFNFTGPDLDMVVTDPSHWIFANTGLRAGQRLLGLLGYEIDATNRFSPPGTRVACASPYLWIDTFISQPLFYSDAASYTAASGATVFASGSMQWSWGLDDFNVPALRSSRQSPAVQHITRNILAGMLNAPPPAPTLFFRTDVSTVGNWQRAYGVEGYEIPGDATNLPAYAAVNVSGATVSTYLPTSADTNSLQQSAAGGRQLSGWASPTNFTMDLNLADGQNHQVAFYFWDWNNAGRTQMVQVIDATTGNLLDQQTIAGFTTGQWWVWQVNGHVQFQFSNLAGPDCLANAVVFGSGAAIQFLGEDGATQGNWPPYYGADGAYIAGDLPAAPAYGNVLVGDPRLTYWSLTATDPRAPAPYGTNTGVFAAWGASGNSLNTFRLNLTDNAWHQLAVYCVDADHLGRKQTLSLVDPSNNAVLDSRDVTNFAGGKYEVWNVRGALTLRLQSSSGVSAALSAVLLGPPNLPPAVALTTPFDLQAFYLPTNIVLAADAADPDGTVSQVSFYANGNCLATVTNPPFTFLWTNALAGQYSLTAVALDNRMAPATSLPSRITVAAGPGYQPPVVQIVSPTDGSVTQAPANISLSANATYTSAPVTSLQFLVDGAPVGPPLTNPPFTFNAGNLSQGAHAVSASVTDAFGLLATSPTNHVTILAPNAAAVFRYYDAAHQGNWESVYGSEGYSLINLASRLPAYATSRAIGAASVTWATSTYDPRALQRPGRADRSAAAWYAMTDFSLDVNFVDGNPHRLGLYCVDWNNQGGTQTVQVLDAGTGALLDTENLASYSNGVYLVWDVVGHVQFSFTESPTNLARMLSGIFFDPPRTNPMVLLLAPFNGSRFASPANVQLSAFALSGPAALSRVEFLANDAVLGADLTGPLYSLTWHSPPPGTYTLRARAVDATGTNGVSAPVLITVEPTSAAAVFAFSDTNSQGNWLGTYGQQGYLVAGDSTNPPPDVSMNLGSQLVVWAGSTPDPRALQRDTGATRVAAAWYAFTNLNVDVQFTDAAFHRVSLYSVDWPNFGGMESVDVLDGLSRAVLDHRVVPPFASGILDAWDVKGHLTFRIQRTNGAPAMVSGLFFDVSPILPAIAITNPPNGTIFEAPANIAVTADGAADPKVSRLEFYQGTTLLGIVSNGPPYTFLWTNVPAGNPTLTVHEVSQFGTSNSAPVHLTVIPGNDFLLTSVSVLPGGLLQLNGLAPPGQPVWLQATTNPGPGAVWVSLLTNTSGSNQVQFILTDLTNFPQRFYRTGTPR
jgi:hypothetical protein